MSEASCLLPMGLGACSVNGFYIPKAGLDCRRPFICENFQWNGSIIFSYFWSKGWVKVSEFFFFSLLTLT